jgi:DNA-binding CsgD family transcriptional regulator
LVIAESTAKFHVLSILHKLGATTRAQAVALAAQRGLL